ncbi:MAG: LPS export ABC transporter ATP-binding protein [bacterium]|nr:LPS export ABC transporter ATP-binding protein [bacterium]
MAETENIAVDNNGQKPETSAHIAGLPDDVIRGDDLIKHIAKKPGQKALEAFNLVKIYRRRRVVDEVDLRVTEGKIVGLLGPNGAGKTTSFYMMVGLIRPNKGRIFLNNKEITRLPIYQRARAGLGYLAQEPSIFRKLTIEENVLLILEALGVSYRERMNRMEDILNELDLTHLRRSVGNTLSGGERRRCEIARALAGSPDFMLLDEPFTGVDPIAIQDIQRIILMLVKKGIGILITDHSVRDILAVSDWVYIMHQGKILQSGTAREIADSDIARKYYLGERFKADDSLFSILDKMGDDPPTDGAVT